jgi:hypothetical protein
MEISRRLLTVAFIYLLCAAPGCQPIQFQWQGPSTAFKVLDLNGDGIVTRPEWEAKYGTLVSRANASVLQFEHADCERDGRLTWSEYFQARFKGRTCDTALLSFYLEDSMKGPDVAVEIVGGRDSMNDESLFSMYSESPRPVSAQGPLRLECSPARWTEAQIECSLSNALKQDTLTLIVLTVTLEVAGSRSASTHAKTVWVPPGTSTQLIIRSRSAKLTSNVEVKEVRVLKRHAAATSAAALAGKNSRPPREATRSPPCAVDQQ